MFVLNLLNEQRLALGLAPLMPHARLQQAARDHGEDMFAQGYFSHRSLDGRTVRKRIAEAGVRVRIVGENLAYAADIHQAYDALTASRPHHRNMFYPDYRLVGIGVVDGGPDGVILVEDFADEGSYPLGRWWEKPVVSARKY